MLAAPLTAGITVVLEHGVVFRVRGGGHTDSLAFAASPTLGDDLGRRWRRCLFTARMTAFSPDDILG